MESQKNNALIAEVLKLPVTSIAYTLHSRLAELFPNQYILETTSHYFNLGDFADAGHCTLNETRGAYNIFRTTFGGPDQPIGRSISCGWLEGSWEGTDFKLVTATWPIADEMVTMHWLITPTRAQADALFAATCIWGYELREEILIYANGCWNKSKELYTAIDNAKFDDLILAADLKETLRQDFKNFLSAKDTYARYNIPWKRGALLLGPPGNGKTHCIKALIKELGLPCMYVQSFSSPYQPDEAGVRDVFERARNTAPCLMVLEDLDSIINEKSRAFFLNELDGFASNTGIITIATTNHPEKLDPAILERPSRFDRKYHFNLPAHSERLAYATHWNDNRLGPEIHVDDAIIQQIADETEGFSFAYLKEIFLSGMMAHISVSSSIAERLVAQIEPLRAQLKSTSEARSLAYVIPDE